MKRLFSITGVLILLLIVSGCSSNDDQNGNSPSDIPVKWVNALIQNNEKMQFKLLKEKYDDLDKKQGSKNEKSIEHYQLIQWKQSKSHYFYKIKYQDPTDENNLHSTTMEVVNTDNGWKRKQYLDVENFDEKVSGMKKKILREMSQ